MSRIISQQADRFGHAHSITQDRLKAYKLILPVDSADNPDYSYMESYIKNLMAQKYTEYLDFKKKNLTEYKLDLDYGLLKIAEE